MTEVDIRDFVTVGEAAQLLDVSPRTIRRHCERGTFPGARPRFYRGTTWLIPRWSLEVFLPGVSNVADLSEK